MEDEPADDPVAGHQWDGHARARRPRARNRRARSGRGEPDQHDAIELEELSQALKPGLDRLLDVVAGQVHERAREAGEECLEAQPLLEGLLGAAPLLDERSQAEQRNGDDEQEDLQRDHARGGGQRRERPPSVGARPDRHERGGQEGKIGRARPEAYRGPQEEWQQEGQRGTRRPKQSGRTHAPRAEGHDGDGDERRGEKACLRAPANRRSPHPAAIGCDGQDGRDQGQRREDVGEEPGAPDGPVMLAGEPGDGGGVRKRGNEGCREDGPRDEDDHAAERVEAGRGIAEVAHADGGDEGLAAVRGEEREHPRGRPPCRQFRGQMRGERRQQVDPPAPPRREEEGGGQDRVGWPQHRRGRRRDPQDEADVRPDVIGQADQQRRRRDLAGRAERGGWAFPFRRQRFPRRPGGPCALYPMASSHTASSAALLAFGPIPDHGGNWSGMSSGRAGGVTGADSVGPSTAAALSGSAGSGPVHTDGSVPTSTRTTAEASARQSEGLREESQARQSLNTSWSLLAQQERARRYFPASTSPPDTMAYPRPPDFGFQAMRSAIRSVAEPVTTLVSFTTRTCETPSDVRSPARTPLTGGATPSGLKSRSLVRTAFAWLIAWAAATIARPVAVKLAGFTSWRFEK